MTTLDKSRDREFGVTPVAVEFTFGAYDSIPVQTVSQLSKSSF